MRNLLLILPLLLLMSGCKVTRKVVEDEKRQWSIDSVATVQSKHDEAIAIDWIAKDSAWWSQNIKIVIYDTDKEATDGQYPVKAIIESHSESGNVESENLVVDKTIADSVAEHVEIHDEGKIENHKKTDTKADTGFPTDMLILALVIILITTSIRLWLKK